MATWKWDSVPCRTIDDPTGDLERVPALLELVSPLRARVGLPLAHGSGVMHVTHNGCEIGISLFELGVLTSLLHRPPPDRLTKALMFPTLRSASRRDCSCLRNLPARWLWKRRV